MGSIGRHTRIFVSINQYHNYNKKHIGCCPRVSVYDNSDLDLLINNVRRRYSFDLVNAQDKG